MIYLLDTNAISDLVHQHPSVREYMRQAHNAGHVLAICQPVYYEVRRGFLWKHNLKKIAILQNKLLPLLSWIALTDNDWTEAAQFWADATNKGRSIEDIDLLVAAIARRLDAIIVSSDTDFDALPVKQEDRR